MATDMLYFEFAAKFPNAVAKIIEAGADDFEAKSLTVKRTVKRADLFSHRIRKLKLNAVSKLLGGFTMLDTPIGKEIMQMGVRKGVQKGLKKGIPQGAHHVLLRQIATRFGRVPDNIRRKIVTIKDTKELDRIAVALLTTRSLAELKKAL